MSSSNETGLGLFDDAASAAGNFPTALRGYDRSAVDDYVRSLEGALVQLRRRTASLEQQAGSLQDQLREATEQAQSPDVDYSDLGGRATDILRLAEEQAREVLDHAQVDAERLKEEAKRDADQARADAAKAGGDIKTSGRAEIEELRTRGQDDIRQQLEKAKAEAEAIVAAARRQAESLQLAADHEAQTLRQNAYLDTEALRRNVESEVSEVRLGVAKEREAAVGHLREVHDESVAKTSALLAEATAHHQQATERLDADIAEAARIRAEALAEAERVKLDAAQEAEDRIVAARKQAAAITDRTQQEFAWRKQQLRRETDLLGQRKQAVLNQLASLSALAEQTAHSFPDLEDLDDFDGEQGDRTIMMPTSMAPALPKDGPSTRGAAAEEGQPAASEETGAESQTETRVNQAVQPGADSPRGEQDRASEVQDNGSEDTMEIDGDATVLVPAADLPAGTAHLHSGARPKKG